VGGVSPGFAPRRSKRIGRLGALGSRISGSLGGKLGNGGWVGTMVGFAFGGPASGAPDGLGEAVGVVLALGAALGTELTAGDDDATWAVPLESALGVELGRADALFVAALVAERSSAWPHAPTPSDNAPSAGATTTRRIR
jgi:hypothetical protein